MAQSATLKVFRFDPSTDEEPRFETYEFPVEDTTQTWSVLKALRWINAHVEPVQFDYNCRWGGCGRCGMNVNGVPHLACWCAIEAGKIYTVEPLAGFPVIRDLIVDTNQAYERFVGSELQMKTYQPLTELKNLEPSLWWGASENGMAAKDFDRCRECMQCYSVCKALNESGKWSTYVGPGAMMQIAARHYDTEDQADRLSQAVFSGAFECEQCGNCEMVCPSQIKIKTVIDNLRAEAVEKGLCVEGVASTANWPAL